MGECKYSISKPVLPFANEFGYIFGIHFQKQSFPVSLYGVDTEEELLGYFVCTHTLCQQFEDFLLTWRQDRRVIV